MGKNFFIVGLFLLGTSYAAKADCVTGQECVSFGGGGTTCMVWNTTTTCGDDCTSSTSCVAFGGGGTTCNVSNTVVSCTSSDGGNNSNNNSTPENNDHSCSPGYYWEPVAAGCEPCPPAGWPGAC